MNEAVRQFLDKEFKEIKRMHQLNSLFSRYEKLHGEQIKQLQEKFQTSKRLVISALYSSDYIVVASEVKESISDEERIQEIIEFFKQAIQKDEISGVEKEPDWSMVTYIVAFVYQLASLMRKRYYFMLDKGVPKEVAAAQISDIFIVNLLDYCKEVMVIDYKWLAILVRTALTQDIFSKAQDWLSSYLTLDERTLQYLLPQVIAQAIPKEIEGETNKAVPLQYYNETDVFYVIKVDSETISYNSNNAKGNYIKTFKRIIPLLSSDYSHSIKYLRLETKTTGEKTSKNLFLVHSFIEKAEGWLFLYSPIDDINLSLAEELLKLKINEIKVIWENKKLLPPISIKKKEEHHAIEKEKREEEKVKKKKKSFVQKLLSIFKKKKVTEQKAKVIKPVNGVFEEFKALFADQFIVALVAGIDLGINVYDAYREQEFEINGILESSLDTSPPTIFYSEGEIQYPSELLDPIIATLDFAKEYVSEITTKSVERIIPEEAFFEVRENPDKSRLIELGCNDKRSIGIVADKYVETHLITKKKVPKYKRRTIIKKVREALSARNRNKMEDVIVTLFAADINPKELKKSTEDLPLFYKA